VTGGLITYFHDLLTPVATFLSEKTREKAVEKACQHQQTPISSDSQFIILVSRLTRDPDRSHTDRVMQAFQNERGFQAIRICDSLSLDYSKDSQTVAAAAKQRAQELIKANHADLLLFGDVAEQNKAIMIYAVNENGGCDLQPKPTEIKLGVLGSDFTADQKEKLIKVSLKEIQSACLNQSSIDWSNFAKRMNKMAMFLKDFDFNEPNSLYFAGSYLLAMQLLFKNGQDDVWFSKGEEFAKLVINKDHAKDQETSESLSWVYVQYAALLDVRFEKTKDKTDQDAVIGAADKAIGLDPKNAFAYRGRGYAYSNKGDWERAVDDYTKAISIDTNDAFAYRNRGYAYSNKGEWDRAIKDYTKAIGLDPKVAADYTARGKAYGAKHDWDHAIADYDKAIELDPKSTICACAYTDRGDAYLAKGDRNRAIKDYNQAIDFDSQAIQRDGKNAAPWNSRCWARAIVGELNEALSDCNRSLDLEPNKAETLDSRGFVYLKMGKVEDAIADYNIALGLNPRLATSLYGRGVAKQKKGEIASGDSDIESAKKIQPNIADEFQRYGIQVKQLSQSPSRSQTGHGHRSRQRADR
jgi:tetratricopeptide (TPR) repeat protein